jgi:ATP-dependent exoDNAse (exonuclease V) beta subunit
LESKLQYFLDPNFKFDEASHIYTYLDSNTRKPIQIFKSVTGFLSQFKEKFDSDRVAAMVAKKKGVSKASILNEWKETSDAAMDLGTIVHKWIEDYYNGSNPEMPTHPEVLKRVNRFLELQAERLHKLTPVHQEFRLFSRKWGLAGTMDALFKMGDDYYVGDWKTNKKFTSDADMSHDKYAKKLLYPFEDLWDNSVNGYSIQLSMYRLIMQEEAGFETKGAFLVWIGPNEKPKLYKTVDLRDRLYTFLQKNNLNI